MTGFPPIQTCFWLLRGCLGGLAIATLQLLLSSFIRSFALPIAIALLGSIAGLLFSSRDLGLYCPYSLMLLGMNSNKSEDVLGQNTVLFFVICAVYLLGVSLTGIGRIKNKKG